MNRGAACGLLMFRTRTQRIEQRLRSLTLRMAIADPLLDWGSHEESIDAEEVLRNLEESLTRELERRRH